MDNLKKTPLYQTHVDLGGKMVDFGGWALPVQYSSIIEEHRAVREACGLFDVSHMGEVDVRGKDAFAYLQKLCTNDLTTMTPGRCRYSMMCYADGGVVDDILVYKHSDDHYMIVVNAGNADKDYAWFEEHVFGDVQLENQSPAWAQLALQGPLFQKVLDAVGYTGEIPAKNYTFTPKVIVGGIKCLVSRTGYTGEDGVELYCAAADGPALHKLLLNAGQPYGLLPAALGARDSLRFEAAMPLYGHEMTDEITPLETNIGFAVKMEKDDFIGKQALQAPIKRRRIGLKLTDRGIVREHYDVYQNGKLVGFTTSGVPVPTLEGSHAMALVDIGVADAEDFEVEIRGKKLHAVQVPLPFYKRSK
ncbi:MAG: glycine cleavage system aminomethyltransferase GcvT [Christensenellaceae bacterium]|jgi:aminomethyltransferase|nr:glycine cleavage system aminomethyltransferase GcvT [Christensenellaceae bacterium]